MKIVSKWEDSLIWCPSQCTLDIKYHKRYQIYLRWRWHNPWTARLYEINDKGSWINTIYLLISNFKDSELKQLKKEVTKLTRIYLKKKYFLYEYKKNLQKRLHKTLVGS